MVVHTVAVLVVAVVALAIDVMADETVQEDPHIQFRKQTR
jgi:hypothetical protein